MNQIGNILLVVWLILELGNVVGSVMAHCNGHGYSSLIVIPLIVGLAAFYFSDLAWLKDHQAFGLMAIVAVHAFLSCMCPWYIVPYVASKLRGR